jgi:hypothetical protein
MRVVEGDNIAAMLRLALASGVALGLFALPGVAAAATLPISTPNTLAAVTDAYDTVIVEDGGIANVKSFDGTSGGRLHIKANTIIVRAGGAISVSGLGHKGVEGEPGAGPGGGLLGASLEPGGGAGAIGEGGQGTDMNCALFGGLGGPGYMAVQAPTPRMEAPLGSSGGAANVSGVTAGGRGGGVLILEANRIEIDGIIEARGADGTFGVGAGGGGGGVIYLRAYEFAFGVTARITVTGGNGGSSATTHGGGGAGGLIVFEAPDMGFTNFEVAGGTSGDCMATGQGALGQTLMLPPPAECLDLDEDGATACDGDCHDVDATIGPGQEDKCDGIDNDCNGTIEDACESGGECVEPPDAGAPSCQSVGAGGEGGSEEQADRELVYIGGCGLAQQGTAALSAAIAAALLALASRRRRR